FPDSYTDPRDLYHLLRQRGMDFVTITDHDTIDGNREIAGLEHTFISEEVTTYFPRDPCKLHLLVWGISEAQHVEITTLRENIYDLQSYLQREAISRSVAHALYDINGKFEATPLERMSIIFSHFEAII